MKTNFIENLDQVYSIFSEIFIDSKSILDFLIKFKAKETLDEIFNDEKIKKINLAIELLNTNAVEYENRKKQQAHFAKILAKINDVNFKNELEHDYNIALQFIVLYVTFKFNKRHNTNDKHHESIYNLLDLGFNKLTS